MKAVVIGEFGPPDVLRLEDVPRPSARLRRRWSSTLRSPASRSSRRRSGRAGAPSKAMLPALPAILGNGVGGTVIRVGEEAGPGLLGQRVVAALGGKGGVRRRGRRGRGGSWSRYRTGWSCGTRPRCSPTAVPRSASRNWPGPGAATPSSSRPRRAAWARCSCSSPATRAPGSSPWPAGSASSRWPVTSGPTWSSTTATRAGRHGSARPRERWTSSSTASAATSAWPRSDCLATAAGSARSAWRAAGSPRSALTSPASGASLSCEAGRRTRNGSGR